LKLFIRLFFFICCLSLFVFCLSACEKQKKQGKLKIIEQEFTLRHDTENTFTIDARGIIKNIGDVDIKKVVVTGNCVSCTGKWGVGQWQASPDIEKMPQQKDIISYIAAGDEETFSFTEVADYLLTVGETKPEMPEKLEIVIVSFETVE